MAVSVFLAETSVWYTLVCMSFSVNGIVVVCVPLTVSVTIMLSLLILWFTAFFAALLCNTLKPTIAAAHTPETAADILFMYRARVLLISSIASPFSKTLAIVSS